MTARTMTDASLTGQPPDGQSPAVRAILARYPKIRPALSPRMAELHKTELRRNRERETLVSSISNMLESWMHRQVAFSANGGETLEIGAGTLNHIPHERPRADAPYDAVEPFAELYEGKPEAGNLRGIYADISELPPERLYDRVISIATLEHLTHLPEVVAAAALRMKPGALFSAGIPSEGGFLWGLSWRLSTGLAFRLKTGLDWSEHMAYEHVNTAPEILEVLRLIFREVEVRRFPTFLHQLSLYAHVEARDPDVALCREIVGE
jgi:SAM-dependent methyltransferase